MEWFLGRMSAGDTFVDVGANIGIYSLHGARRVGHAGKIIAFEPTPETFQILKTNVKMNQLPNVDCRQLALADRNGKLSLVAGDRPASNRFAGPTQQIGKGLEISATTLDEFCSANSVAKVDFIKADIEGGERDFFVGARSILIRDKPMILFESMHTGPLFPERTILREIGYKLYFFELKGLVEISEKSSRGGNIIAQAL